MRSIRRHPRRLTAATVVVTAAALVLSGAAANATVDRAGPAGVSDLPSEIVQTVAGTAASVPLTLVTGDRVQVSIGPDGKPVVHDVQLADRPDRRPVAFHTFTRGESGYAVPADALPLLQQGVLDWELFNLTKLAKLAAHGTIGATPVIVTHPARARAAQAPSVSGAQALPSIDGTSMTIEGDGAWWRAVRQATTGSGRSGPDRALRAGPLAGVEKVWLNELLEISLDQSVPQVGAPAAWDSGYDGAGVTVAVLDTGIDASHPDVAGKVVEQVDFTGNPDGPLDGHGHGTHVAATIAGTGAASDGLRPGVAPGAELLVGKVCSDAGGCPTDAIIGGMQWAAQSGARVVSMSLGGGPTDGTDPLSEAVNTLSRQFGTLFVIAAGNDGPGPETVAAPGVADEALAVAAVDKQDQMADFSSRGPRAGDGALKPDIAAPGVDIVAARAAGTAMGTPVDEHYTTASGTSMATPHVSGAAAIIAQQNPELAGPALKALLMGTSYDLGHDLYAQGAGRLDVARAVDPDIFANNVHFGRQEYGQPPATGTITYTNVTPEPISLELSASLADRAGAPAPAGLLTLATDAVTVPAGGTAEVAVTLDGSVLGPDGVYGPYSGVVVATDGTGAQRATSRLGAFLEPQRFDLTVELVAPAGATDLTYDPWTVLPVDDQDYLHDGALLFPGGETMAGRVFPGAYSVTTTVRWQDAGGEQQVAVASAPEVEVGRSATTVRLDLRRAEPVAVETPARTETYRARLGYERVSATGEWAASTTLEADYAGGDPDWWALPTGPVEIGSFRFASQHVLVPPQLSMRVFAGHRSFRVHPRYATPDVSVPGGVQRWQDGEELRERSLRVKVPRLAGADLTRLVYAGDGSPAALTGVDVDGRLVLITPTDLCTPGCDFPALRERVVAAAEAGATGVLVAAGEGRAGIGGPSNTQRFECADGWDSCPEVEEYAPIPIASLSADEATRIVDGLGRRSSTRVFWHGQDELSGAYALAYLEDRVPRRLPHRVRLWELDRVEHRFHASQPGEVGSLTWRPFVATEQGLAGSAVLDLPTVARQRSLAVYTGPRDRETIHRFQASTFGYAEPSVVDSGSVLDEEQDVILGSRFHRDEVSWNHGPSVPGALEMPVTRDGFAIGGALCAGCREGDVLYPVVYRTTGDGARSTMVGMVNDTGLAELFLGSETCEPPTCEAHLYDAGGTEIEQRLIRIELRIGGAGADIPASGQLDGLLPGGLSGKETGR